MLASVQQQRRRRFNLLLLEEGEYYFGEDFAGFLYQPPDEKELPIPPVLSRKRHKGRIHVCSRSLIFDPDEVRVPLLKLYFRDIASIRARTSGDEEEYFVVAAKLAVDIQLSHPYVFRKLDPTTAQGEFGFTISYMSLSRILPLLSTLHAVERADERALGGRKRADVIAELIEKKERSIAFDNSWIVDIRERPLLPGGEAIVVRQITPLVVAPGCLMLTDQRIYFQPFNNVATEPVQRFNLSDIVAVHKRRHVMRDVALEILFANTSASSSASSSSSSISTPSSSSSSSPPPICLSAFFAFKSAAVRDSVLSLLSAQPACPIRHQPSLPQLTEAWCRGDLSNLDYLLALNTHAGRSFQDLTQYPVMPWVIADYTSETLDLSNPATYRDLSRPIGALNPKRLEQFRQRMRDMPPEMSPTGKPFLYGTHYSSPGYVLYYLVRKAPEYQLRLQNGRFDQPDRLFTSVASTWQSCLSASTDVKELIPEFYCSDGLTPPGSFLTNETGLDLGVRQSGREVGDVELPPWVRTRTPQEFVRICREALESDWVSGHLHQWIDLIFGYKQRGDEAARADNLFHPLTYEGAVDIDAVEDPMERRSLEAQIAEFGQTPKKLFDSPHPQRGRVPYVPPLFTRDAEAKAASPEPATEPASPPAQASPKAPESATSPSSGGGGGFLSRLLSGSRLTGFGFGGAASVVSPTSSGSGRATPTPGAGAGAAAPKPLPTPHRASSKTLRPSSSPGSVSNGTLSKSSSGGGLAEPGEGDIAPAPSQPIRIDTSSSGPSPSPSASPLASPSLSLPPTALMSPTDAPLEVLPLELASELGGLEIEVKQLSPEPPTRGGAGGTGAEGAAGADAKEARPRWAPLGTLKCTERLNLHSAEVTGLALSSGGDELFSVSADGTIKLWSLVEGKQRRSSKLSSMALSALCLTTPEGKSTVAASSYDGHVYLWSVGFGRTVSHIQAHDDAVSCLALRASSVLSGAWDGTVKLWKLREAEIEKAPLFESAEHEGQVECCALDATGQLAVTGGDDGSLILWDQRMRGHARQLEAHADAVRAVQFLPEGTGFLSCSDDGSIRHFDGQSSVALETLEVGEKLRVLDTDGRQVYAAGEEGILRSWQLPSYAAMAPQDLTEGAGPVRALAVSRDGRTIAAGLAQKRENIFLFKNASF